MAEFEPGDPHSGYYNDLRPIAKEHGVPASALVELRRLSAEPEAANAVSIIQLGLAAWQLHSGEERWLEVTGEACGRVLSRLDDRGGLRYLFPMPHTYRLMPPWYSAMAQGEAASLLTRAAEALGDPVSRMRPSARSIPCSGANWGSRRRPRKARCSRSIRRARRHTRSMAGSSASGVFTTSLSRRLPRRRRRALSPGVRPRLPARLPLYDAGLGWSRYDLFPHPIVHVASPFYHRLHAEQLLATARLRPDLPGLAATGERWRDAAGRPLPRAVAVARKIAFRLIRPRRLAA